MPQVTHPERVGALPCLVPESLLGAFVLRASLFSARTCSDRASSPDPPGGRGLPRVGSKLPSSATAEAAFVERP